MSLITSNYFIKNNGTAKEEQQEEEEDNHQHHELGDQSPQLFIPLHDVMPSSSPLLPLRSLPLLNEISSPINAQIFEFCNPDIFSNTLQNSEATSSPDGCNFDQDQKSCYATNMNFFSTTETNNSHNNMEALDISKLLGDQSEEKTSTTSSSTTTNNPPSQLHNQNNIGSLSVIFHSHDDINDISASIDFSPSSSSPFSCSTPHYTIRNTNNNNEHKFYQLPLNDMSTLCPYPNSSSLDHATIPLSSVFNGDCLSPILPFLRLNPSNSSSTPSYLDPTMASFNLNNGLGVDNSNIFSGSMLTGTELENKETDFQGDNAGIFCPDQLTGIYNSEDKQAFSNESSQLVGATTSSAPLGSEISSLEDSSFKVGKLSVEQKKEKIHRYLKKRNQRNFSKKIKYACRKTLADSRPRVRGRFAKNDEFMETHRHNGHQDDDDYDDMAVKDEDELVDSSDIFSHISGVNSFKCNYQIQSWI